MRNKLSVRVDPNPSMRHSFKLTDQRRELPFNPVGRGLMSPTIPIRLTHVSQGNAPDKAQEQSNPFAIPDQGGPSPLARVISTDHTMISPAPDRETSASTRTRRIPKQFLNVLTEVRHPQTRQFQTLEEDDLS